MHIAMWLIIIAVCVPIYFLIVNVTKVVYKLLDEVMNDEKDNNTMIHNHIKLYVENITEFYHLNCSAVFLVADVNDGNNQRIPNVNLIVSEYEYQSILKNGYYIL